MKNSNITKYMLTTLLGVVSIISLAGCGNGSGNSSVELTTDKKTHTLHFNGDSSVCYNNTINYHIKIENLPLDDDIEFQLLDLSKNLRDDDNLSIYSQISNIDGVEFDYNNLIFKLSKEFKEDINFSLNIQNRANIKLEILSLNPSLKVQKSSISKDDNSTVNTFANVCYVYTPVVSQPTPTPEPEPTPTGTPLVIGVPMKISSGDTINPTSEDTVIETTHNIDDDTKYVTLISGSAELISGNVEIE
jgi:hypothetical protein